MISRKPGRLRWVLVRTVLLSLALQLVCIAAPQAACAQTASYATSGTPEEEGLLMLQVDPYDLIFFTEAAGGGWVKTPLLQLPNRQVPSNPSGNLSFSVIGLEGKRFTAKWADIERVELWEQRLEREARRGWTKAIFREPIPSWRFC